MLLWWSLNAAFIQERSVIPLITPMILIKKDYLINYGYGTEKAACKLNSFTMGYYTSLNISRRKGFQKVLATSNVKSVKPGF